MTKLTHYFNNERPKAANPNEHIFLNNRDEAFNHAHCATYF